MFELYSFFSSVCHWEEILVVLLCWTVTMQWEVRHLTRLVVLSVLLLSIPSYQMF